ncbi:MAG: metallophosphoesterase [Balneolia bacterium]|nr:metallophosphoesterase [Balneolia bacterium]
MSNFLLFLVFYTLMVLVFGSMQYVVFQTFKKWYTFSFSSSVTHDRLKKLAIGILVVGNLLFFPRFAITYTTWHESLLLQKFLINPGGIYFAFIFMLFVFSALYSGFSNLYKFTAFIKRFIQRDHSYKQAQKTTAAAPEPAAVPEYSSVNDNKTSGGLYSRREFIRTAGTVAFGAPLLLTSGLSAATHRNYVISKQTFYYPNLPSGLEGLKIAHISDIHSGIYMNSNQIREIYEIVNSLNPNISVITGDMVDTHESEIPAIRDTIDMLKTDYGVFGCPGNHDHYASINGLQSALTDKPISLLRNRSHNLTINGEPVSIIGIDDAGETGRNFDDLDAALAGANPESFKILLSHRPHKFEEAAHKDINLTLSGHTHGGQIGFDLGPLELYPIDLFQKYSRGHYQKGDHQLYVNVGVGLVGAPIRLVRPEITEITLTSNPELKGSVVVNA